MKSNLFVSVVLTCGFFYTTAVFCSQNSGFLSATSAPDSLAILPAPPAGNSVAFLNDKTLYESGQVSNNLSRRVVANKDAEYKNFGAAFSDAFGEEISERHTPVLYRLLKNVLQDSHDYAMRSAKHHYERVRPFVIYKDSTCTPDKDLKMAKTGSYPSGHASFGWATALVLAEINPERETEILRRGYDFGDSRVVCGAHWQSDVDSGRIMGAAVVAALHANDKFVNALKAAKKEFVALKSRKHQRSR